MNNQHHTNLEAMYDLKEKIDIVRAADAGASIEFRTKGTRGSWAVTVGPVWNWDINDYRIAEGTPKWRVRNPYGSEPEWSVVVEAERQVDAAEKVLGGPVLSVEGHPGQYRSENCLRWNDDIALYAYVQVEAVEEWEED